MEIVQVLLGQIVSLKTEIYELKNGGAAVSTDAPEVSIFLDKGRKAMRIVSKSNEKSKLNTSKSKKKSNLNDVVGKTHHVSNVLL